MKFSSSVDALSQQCRTQRQLINWLLAFEAVLGVALIVEGQRAPIYLERSSRGLEILAPTVPQKSGRDLKRLAEFALKARFETSAESSSLFLSAKQAELRAAEQREMRARNLVQSVVIRSVELGADSAIADVDRVLAMGDVRSAVRSSLKIAFEETEPNELNPYGLRLALAEPVEIQPLGSAKGKEAKR